jgi:EAL domain-containing protein (putative c-di-GMP-specific phosphodiesterase class I)
VIDRAARQCREWLDRQLDLKISINLSALDLLNETLPEILQRALVKHRLSADHLGLEITESAVMRDPKSALNLLTRLRDAGFSLSIDDFGTGYSSLAQLKRMPVDELKIDKSFVMELALDSEDAIIVKSTIDLAHSMGLRVVAEGIETQAGWAALKQFGCETGQGYFISKPLAADDFEQWMRETGGRGNRFLVDAA